MNKIDVPVFMACPFQDEQTGGHCPTLAKHFTGTQQVVHVHERHPHDSLAPETFNRWYDFLSSTSRNRRRHQVRGDPGRRTGDLPRRDGHSGGDAPGPGPVAADYAGALAAFEQLKPIRLLFDNGAGGPRTARRSRLRAVFRALAIPGTTARIWYFAANGGLRTKPPLAWGPIRPTGTRRRGR